MSVCRFPTAQTYGGRGKKATRIISPDLHDSLPLSPCSNCLEKGAKHTSHQQASPSVSRLPPSQACGERGKTPTHLISKGFPVSFSLSSCSICWRRAQPPKRIIPIGLPVSFPLSPRQFMTLRIIGWETRSRTGPDRPSVQV